MDNYLSIQELGKVIRTRRTACGLTQADLARRAGLSRNTLNRLENGLFPDLGLKKAAAILEQLDMELDIKPKAKKRAEPDFIGMAAQSASVSFKARLSPDELVHALLSGNAPKGKKAHLIALLEEASPSLFAGLVGKVETYAPPGKVLRNMQKLAQQVGLVKRGELWKKAA